jgi:hypothetical protein
MFLAVGCVNHELAFGPEGYRDKVRVRVRVRVLMVVWDRVTDERMQAATGRGVHLEQQVARHGTARHDACSPLLAQTGLFFLVHTHRMWRKERLCNFRAHEGAYLVLCSLKL